jgi:hypothetical protein
VAAFWDNGALVLNGYTTAITVASPMIQAKNTRGSGAAISSRCMMAVAASATAAAASTYAPVDASPHAPSCCGARIGTVNSHRDTKMPTSAISAATTAVTAPPAHSVPGSSLRKALGGPDGSGTGPSSLRIGIVIVVTSRWPADLSPLLTSRSGAKRCKAVNTRV